MQDDKLPVDSHPFIERRLATIMVADVFDYSRMMQSNEERTVEIFRGHREIFDELIRQHRGRIFNTAGDSVLAEFPSAVESVRCATEIQAALRTRNEHLAPEEKMQFRIGINLGDVIIQGSDFLGDGVNIAARIQTATTPGGICISGSVYDQIQNKLSLDFKLLGEQTYKNIAKPVRTYTINEGAAVTTLKRRTGWRVLASLIATAGVLAIAGAGYWGYLQYNEHRTGQARVDTIVATQLAAQKQATERAQHAAEEAKREVLQAQKLVENEGLRRAQEERSRVEQDRKLLDAERRAAEEAKRQAADEALRRVQEERTQLDQERTQLEAEKKAVEAARKQADAHQGAVSIAMKEAPKLAASHGGTYTGRLCNQFPNKAPSCWPVALAVRNGIAEGNWIGNTQKTAKVRGTIADDGTVQLNLAGWAPNGAPVEANLTGSIVDGAITASGKWNTGGRVTGEWKRTQVAAAAPVATPAPKSAVSYKGTYTGRLCNQVPNKEPACWPVMVVVRNGGIEGSWISRVQKTATARGTVADDGTVQLSLAAWAPNGTPVESHMTGRIVDGAITASGRWNTGGGVTGEWKRTQ